MRALLVTWTFPPHKAIGAHRWGRYYELSLNDPDLQIDVLTANWSGETTLRGDSVHRVGETLVSTPSYSVNRQPRWHDVLLHPTLALRSLDRSAVSPWLRAAREWIDRSEIKPDVVIGSYSPVASVMAAEHARRKWKIPMVIDLRDLISQQGQKIRIPGLHAVDCALDKRLTQSASAFFTVSPTTIKKAEEFYRRPVHPLYNCFTGMPKPFSCPKPGAPLTFFYAGTLGLARTPAPILRILDEYAASTDRTITVNFAGQDDPRQFLETEPKHIDLQWLGYIERSEVQQREKEADVLLLLEDQTPAGAENLTGKIFEYFAAGKPILASCHPDSDIAAVLKETNTGRVVADAREAAEFIRALEKEDLRPDTDQLSRFSCRSQYQSFKTALSSMTVA